MSDSLLDEALRESRANLDLFDDDDPEARSLRARTRILEAAAASTELTPDARDRLARLAKLVVDLRDEVEDFRKRHVARRMVEAMID